MFALDFQYFALSPKRFLETLAQLSQVSSATCKFTSTSRQNGIVNVKTNILFFPSLSDIGILNLCCLVALYCLLTDFYVNFTLLVFIRGLISTQLLISLSEIKLCCALPMFYWIVSTLYWHYISTVPSPTVARLYGDFVWIRQIFLKQIFLGR